MSCCEKLWSIEQKLQKVSRELPDKILFIKVTICGTTPLKYIFFVSKYSDAPSLNTGAKIKLPLKLLKGVQLC